MSSTKGAARRAAIFASSSLIALGLAPLAGLSLATTASAAAVCTPPPASGNGTDAVVYGAGTHNPGITCTIAGGGTSSVSTTGAITVSTTGGVPGDPLVNGVNLTAAGSDSISWTSTAGTVTGQAMTNGPVIDVTTNTGAINMSTAAVAGSAATVTHGIRARSTGGGSITVSTTGQVSGTNATVGIAAIEAVASGGNGNVRIETTGTSSGRLYGVFAEANGTGTVTIQAGGTVQSAFGNGAPVDVTGIEARTDLGLLTINANSVSSGGLDGVAIRTTTGGGNAILNLAGSVSGGTNDSSGAGVGVFRQSMSAAIEVNMTGGTTTINNNQTNANNEIGASNSRRHIDDLLRANGSGVLVLNNNIGGMFGQFELSGFTGSFTLNHNTPSNGLSAGGWTTRGLNNFSQGADTINNNEDGVMALGGRESRFDEPLTVAYDKTILDFNGGVNVFNNRGVLKIGTLTDLGDPTAQTAEFIQLTTFNNSGDIVMGEGRDRVTDGFIDDVLVMRDIAFVGSGDGRFIMDVDLAAGGGQSSCTRADESGLPIAGTIADPADAQLGAADCVDMQGSTVTGVNMVEVIQRANGDRGAYIPDGIMLIDVAGGTATAGSIVIDPRSLHYRDVYGGVIDKGIFFYPLVYNAATQQFILYGLPNETAYQPLYVVQAAEQLWRTSTGSVFEREAELREMPREAGLGGGLWFRGAADRATRGATDSTMGGGSTFEWNNGHDVETWATSFGVDLLVNQTHDATFVAGLMGGYANGQMDFDQSDNFVRMDGMTAGLYGSFVSGQLYVDGALNTNWLQLDLDTPGLNLDPTGTLISSSIFSVGGQLEAGWRWKADRISVEPMALFDHVRTSVDDIYVPAGDPVRQGLTVSFADQTSSRAGAGVRLGLQATSDPDFSSRFLLSGRVMRELDEETDLTIEGVNALPLTSQFGGSFSELGLGLAVTRASDLSGGVSAHVGGNMKFGADYESKGFSAALRYQW